MCEPAVYLPDGFILGFVQFEIVFQLSHTARLEVNIMEVLWLTQEEVKSVIDMRSDMQVVESAFRQHGLGKVQMPQNLIFTIMPITETCGQCLRILRMRILPV